MLCISSKTYRTQRQRSKNGPRMGNGIGHDSFSADSLRKKINGKAFFLGMLFLKPLSCSICVKWQGSLLQGQVKVGGSNAKELVS